MTSQQPNYHSTNTAPVSECPNVNSAPPVHMAMLNPSSLIHNDIAVLAQDSLVEVQKLRILLMNLLTSVDQEDSDVDDLDKAPDEGYVTQNSKTLPSPACTTDSRTPVVTLDGRTLPCTPGLKHKSSSDKLMVHKIISQISQVFCNLDQLADRMHFNRLNNRSGDIGLQNALSLFNTVEQLEFSQNTSAIESGLCHTNEFEERLKEREMRRVDWLVDRLEAERWSHRYRERTRTVLEGLLACAVLRRSHLSLEHVRRRSDFLNPFNRNSRTEFEHLLNNLQNTLPDLHITLIEPASVVTIVHLRIGQVMQCFVTFRQFNPERIIVRGISESMLLKNSHHSNKQIDEIANGEEKISQSSEKFLSSILDMTNVSPNVKECVVNLLNPRLQGSKYSTDLKSQRIGVSNSSSNSNQKLVRSCYINFQNLDLFTPSRHNLFQRISSLAQCALLHFSDEYKPPSAVQGFFIWLHSYRDLFNSPCIRCGQLLGQNIELPIWRIYPQIPKSDSHPMEPQHEHCQATV